MNEVTNKSTSWIAQASTVLAAWHDPVARILNVDLLAVVIAILLPWSTSGVVIFAALWIAALLPTLNLRTFLRLLKRPIWSTSGLLLNCTMSRTCDKKALSGALKIRRPLSTHCGH